MRSLLTISCQTPAGFPDPAFQAGRPVLSEEFRTPDKTFRNPLAERKFSLFERVLFAALQSLRKPLKTSGFEKGNLSGKNQRTARWHVFHRLSASLNRDEFLRSTGMNEIARRDQYNQQRPFCCGCLPDLLPSLPSPRGALITSSPDPQNVWT
jgi:hypothetical protein